MEARVRFAVAPSNGGPFGDPREAVRLARAAEEAGWDGYFSWDALIVRDDPPPTYDPWVILSAVATATERIRIGTCIAVIARYKPHVMARTLASLDVLSGGRLMLGVGIGGGAASFEAFGEPGQARIRAERLDEALDIITRLWSGETLTYRGKHFVVDGFRLTAVPLQQPRVPILVGGDSPAALRRAARWDGWIGPDEDPMGAGPDDVALVCERLREAGAPVEGFEVAWGGMTAPGGRSVAAYGEAGATWWVETCVGSREDVMARVAAGPPAGDR